MGACVGVFIRERGGVSDSQNTSIGCLILIQSKPSIRNKILIGRSRNKSRTFANLAATPMW